MAKSARNVAAIMEEERRKKAANDGGKWRWRQTKCDIQR
jgi:hypothetical protein